MKITSDEEEEKRLSLEEKKFEILLSFGLDAPALVLNFKYHPWRLLKLENSSKIIGNRIREVLKEIPEFWYQACLYAFPDAFIMSVVSHWILDVIQKNNATLRAPLLYQKPFSEYNPDNILQMRSFCYDNVNDSFTDPDLLKECQLSRDRAHQVEKCFRVLYPLGIPPSEYFFLSHYHLYQLIVPLYFSVANIELVLTRDYGFARNDDSINLKSIKQDSIEKALNDSSSKVFYQFKSGRVGSFDNLKDTHTFLDLKLLAQKYIPSLILKILPTYKSSQFLHNFLGTLHLRTVEFALTFDLTGELNEKDFKFTGTLNENYKKNRQFLLKHYGTVDPRMIDFNRQGFGNKKIKNEFLNRTDWKKVVIDQIELVKRFGTDKEYAKISTPLPPLSQLSYSHCHTPTTPSTDLFIESLPPHNLFCHAECQEGKG